MKEQLTQVAQHSAEIYAGVMGLLGGLIMMTYRFSTGKQFTIGKEIAGLFLAFFVGIVIGYFLTPDIGAKAGLIAVCGALSRTIVEFLNEYGAKIIKTKVEKTLDIKLDK